MTNFIKDYKEFLIKETNNENAEKQKKYLYSDLNHYGLTTKQQADFVKKYDHLFKGLTKKTALDMAQKLWDSESFEERCAALHIIGIHSNSLDLEDMEWIDRWMRQCKGWALLDGFIIPFMPIILNKDPKAYNYLKKWIKGNDYWVRRSALLAQLLFLRGRYKGGNRQLHLDLAKSQFDESWIDSVYKTTDDKKRARFFIRKAIGWSLRELGNNDPKAAFEFLSENKTKMSGLSFRDGSRRLPPEYRNKL